jgi:hypothetical protein
MVAGRPKLALTVAHATGAAIANPDRYRDNAELSLHPLGPPSPCIIEDGIVNDWFSVAYSASWLTEADRRLVEIACYYRANFRENIRIKVPFIDDDGVAHPEIMMFNIDHKAIGMELRILEKLGCTPVSRPKVTPGGKFAGGKVKRREQWW